MAAGGIDKEYSDNEEGIEMEDMVDDRGEVFPYMFEPETSGEETGSDSDVEINRLNGTQWCHCGHCVVMPTARECRCCREIGKVRNVMDEEGATCITLHPGFEAVCLNHGCYRQPTTCTVNSMVAVHRKIASMTGFHMIILQEIQTHSIQTTCTDVLAVFREGGSCCSTILCSKEDSSSFSI
ncbi:hypothetical protein BSL78_27578 [Apostichopus japonicus]|uniref:Uncharacterized protein n=1 Tax=Stichopus japonicus TaxID=307972 RepID=A0A2G8JIP4_STIJA|nr:hypothetical protein BSL78_27578 [Apostichopus japonicus]